MEAARLSQNRDGLAPTLLGEFLNPFVAAVLVGNPPGARQLSKHSSQEGGDHQSCLPGAGTELAGTNQLLFSDLGSSKKFNPAYWVPISPLFWCFLRRQQAKGTCVEVSQALGLPDVSSPSRLAVMVYNAERCLAACRTGLYYFFLPPPKAVGLTGGCF